jgi:hypothetical protein
MRSRGFYRVNNGIVAVVLEKPEMSGVKDKMTEVIRSQPEDATYEVIMRELAFERMVERGLDDSRGGQVISNAGMERRIRAWQK